MVQYTRPSILSLRSHPILTEKWVQGILAEDPSLLGLGELILKDAERRQAGAGRLDLLFQDADSSSRFEVEIQLGKTDESHIIRTIEYWDIERKRYPQYEHTAVIVAEDITSRFLNVISLFNGAIPLVAIQMTAIQVGDSVSLLFTKVLDQVRLGLAEEDEEAAEPTDRSYWEARASRESMEAMDRVVAIVREVDPALEPKYNKFYVGLARDGQPDNFVVFRPKKSALRVEARIERSDEVQQTLDAAGVDVMDYDSRWGRYRIRLLPRDIEAHRGLLKRLVQMAAGADGEG